MKASGYIVTEYCEDYEQILGLNTGEVLPPGGILIWTDGARAVFESRADARAAIDRTEHYRLAFNNNDLPEKKYCKIVPVVTIESVKGK